MTNGSRRAMVTFYHRHSPALTEFIAKRNGLPAIVRGILTPIVFANKHLALRALFVHALIAFVVAMRCR